MPALLSAELAGCLERWGEGGAK